MSQRHHSLNFVALFTHRAQEQVDHASVCRVAPVDLLSTVAAAPAWRGQFKARKGGRCNGTGVEGKCHFCQSWIQWTRSFMPSQKIIYNQNNFQYDKTGWSLSSIFFSRPNWADLIVQTTVQGNRYPNYARGCCAQAESGVWTGLIHWRLPRYE